MLSPAEFIVFAMREALFIALFCLMQGITFTSGVAADAIITTPQADWSAYRGSPALAGVSASILPAKLSLLWTFKTGKPVKSSPIVGGGKVFIGSDNGKVYAIDFVSGNK